MSKYREGFVHKWWHGLDRRGQDFVALREQNFSNVMTRKRWWGWKDCQFFQIFLLILKSIFQNQIDRIMRCALQFKSIAFDQNINKFLSRNYPQLTRKINRTESEDPPFPSPIKLLHLANYFRKQFACKQFPSKYPFSSTKKPIIKFRKLVGSQHYFPVFNY